MAGSLAIRWSSAARAAGLGLAAIAALAVLAGALEPPAPPPVPPDVGLAPTGSPPAGPTPAAGGEHRGGAWDLEWPDSRRASAGARDPKASRGRDEPRRRRPPRGEPTSATTRKPSTRHTRRRPRPRPRRSRRPRLLRPRHRSRRAGLAARAGIRPRPRPSSASSTERKDRPWTSPPPGSPRSTATAARRSPPSCWRCWRWRSPLRPRRTRARTGRCSVMSRSARAIPMPSSDEARLTTRDRPTAARAGSGSRTRRAASPPSGAAPAPGRSPHRPEPRSSASRHGSAPPGPAATSPSCSSPSPAAPGRRSLPSRATGTAWAGPAPKAARSPRASRAPARAAAPGAATPTCTCAASHWRSATRSRPRSRRAGRCSPPAPAAARNRSGSRPTTPAPASVR